MKTIFTKSFFSVVLLLITAFPFQVNAEVADWTQDQINDAFDIVAKNFGAVEYATYTYMVEYGIAPSSLDELRQSGHLNVIMTNPYNNNGVESLGNEDFPDGFLAGNILVSSNRDDGREAHLEAWYVRRDGDELIARSMVKHIALYQNEIRYDLFFNNELPRDEQFVAVYCVQAVDAFESFQQKVGRSAENFMDLNDNGDVNVQYLNPITGELVKSSETLSPGDYYYEKIGDEGFTLIGWGRDRPVFFGTTDQDAETAFYEEWAWALEDEETASEQPAGE